MQVWAKTGTNTRPSAISTKFLNDSYQWSLWGGWTKVQLCLLVHLNRQTVSKLPNTVTSRVNSWSPLQILRKKTFIHVTYLSETHQLFGKLTYLLSAPKLDKNDYTLFTSVRWYDCLKLNLTERIEVPKSKKWQNSSFLNRYIGTASGAHWFHAASSSCNARQ